MAAAFVHRVSLALAPGGDPAAPGAAVTVALCGHWEHQGPCTWPHHNRMDGDGDVAVLRTVFLAEPADEAAVRRRIDEGVAAGELEGPGGQTRWRVLGSGSEPAGPDDAEWARRAGGGAP